MKQTVDQVIEAVPFGPGTMVDYRERQLVALERHAKEIEQSNADLVAALQWAMSHIERPKKPCPKQVNYDKARAALAKATA